MNILHLKYVVSIAEHGSINQAAEELHVAQPNLSRVVRELEAELGLQFFLRSSRGMMLTPDGELFVQQARKILEQVDEMESLYKERKPGKQRFSVSGRTFQDNSLYRTDAFLRGCFRIFQKIDDQRHITLDIVHSGDLVKFHTRMMNDTKGFHIKGYQFINTESEKTDEEHIEDHIQVIIHPVIFFGVISNLNCLLQQQLLFKPVPIGVIRTEAFIGIRRLVCQVIFVNINL